jgi:hypothetical protein
VLAQFQQKSFEVFSGQELGIDEGVGSFRRLTPQGVRNESLLSEPVIFVAWYNFGWKHEAPKNQTPAMASGLSNYVWTIKELIAKAAPA